ncbi:S26 family signal peptidase [Cohnella sp. REN36]|uniref:S26 family signal peptidase n=1 Tax=Cohnella sp. REN36 TaxID=2887347 RepID=UPI00351D934A
MNLPGSGECGKACMETHRSYFHLNLAPTKVPNGSYFVLGDTTMRSIDSLTLGPLAADRIIGRVVGSTGRPDRADQSRNDQLGLHFNP